ncbi:hypothetical protein AB0F52_09610 [Amycolatopsis sp. NPDC024027]
MSTSLLLQDKTAVIGGAGGATGHAVCAGPDHRPFLGTPPRPGRG